MSFLGTPGEDIFENFGTWAVLLSFSFFTSVKSIPLNAQNDPGIPQWTPKVHQNDAQESPNRRFQRYFGIDFPKNGGCVEAPMHQKPQIECEVTPNLPKPLHIAHV